MNYKITDESGFPTVTVSKIKCGECLYAEEKTLIACSPIASAKDIETLKLEQSNGSSSQKFIPALERKVLTQDQLDSERSGKNNEAPKKSNVISRAIDNFLKETKRTIHRQQMGEKSYIFYKAWADGQKITFGSCFPGTIIPWNATPLEEGEVYVPAEGVSSEVKSVFEDNVKRRPHGTLITVTKSFLVADFKVRSGKFNTGNVDILNFSGSNDRFNVFSTDENALDVKAAREKMKTEILSDSYFDRNPEEYYVFIEVHGSVKEIPLYPGEVIDIYPDKLLAFTDSVSMKMISAGDVVLRNKENNDYVIRMKANCKGGFVYVHSVKPKTFFEKHSK